MTFDPQTLLLVNGYVVALAAFTFIVNSLLARSDAIAKTWSLAFVSGILTTLSYAIYNFAPEAWWSVATGNAAVTLSVAAMWSGCRQFNERTSLLWVSFAGSAFVGLSALVEGSAGGAWAGAAVMFVAIASFAALASAECVRSQMRASRNARPLAGVFILLSAYYLVRTAVFIIDGATGAVFQNYLGTETTTFFTIGLVMMAAISMSVLMESRYPHRAGVAIDGTPAIPGVLNRAQFDAHATLWLARARRDRDSLVFVFLDIANLDDINSAFGSAYGDQAILAVARTITENVPSAAVVAHEGGMHFAILTTAPAIGNTTVVAQNLHTALIETPIDPGEGIRAVAICSVATTDRYGHDLAPLRAAAREALAEATSTGPGTITLATQRRTSG